MIPIYVSGLLSKTWGVIKAVAQWLWSHPIAIASMIGTIVGGFIIYRSNKNQISNLKDAIEVQKAKNSIASNAAKVQQLEKNASANADRVKSLKKEISNSQKKVVEIHKQENLEDMNDEDIAKLFSDSNL